MGIVELLLGVVFVTAFGIGYELNGMANVSNSELWIARGAFIIAALSILTAFFYWLYQEDRNNFSIAILGSIAGLWLCVALPFQLKWVDYRHPKQSSQIEDIEKISTSSLAKLAELGWTVRPTPKSIQFEIANNSLPSMEKSAVYFKQLGKPFNLQFQKVKDLTGLHYLADIPECTKIEINAGEFTDISELKDFIHLSDLGISQLPLNSSGIVDPSALASLTNLQVLRIGSVRIRSVSFLSNLKQIKTLYLGQTLITDISPLSDLPLLEILDIRGTRVTDMRPLKHSENLTDLSIGGDQIPGLPNLAGLKGLKKITLIEQKPFDLTSVTALTNLQSLWIWGPFTGSLDLSPLQNLKSLHDLAVTAGAFFNLTPVTNIQSMSTLTELKTLTLGQVSITDLNFVSNLKNLTQINLNQLPITSIEPLRGLKMLQKISLNSLAVTDISPLLDLPALSDLTIGRTPARSDVIEELRRRGVNVTTY